VRVVSSQVQNPMPTVAKAEPAGARNAVDGPRAFRSAISAAQVVA
jgi:hypothetical protein